MSSRLSNSRLLALYGDALEALKDSPNPAVAQCLRIVVNNLHWAMWISGEDPDWLPFELSFAEERDEDGVTS